MKRGSISAERGHYRRGDVLQFTEDSSRFQCFDAAAGGSGHVWQGWFRTFPIEADAHLLTVLRYVEQNPLRAKPVDHAERWPWSSLRRHRVADGTRLDFAWLAGLPAELPLNWRQRVNRAEAKGEFDALRTSVQRGRPRKTTEA